MFVHAGACTDGKENYVTNAFHIRGVNVVLVAVHRGIACVTSTGVECCATKVLHALL